MDRAIYTAMVAARQTLEMQAVNANNLANAASNGYRAQLSAMRAVPVDGPGLLTRATSVVSTPGFDNTPGPVQNTQRPLDVALQQDGYLAVQLPDGSEAYTRNGSIQLSEAGQLRVQGYPLLSDSGPIDIPPNSTVTIAADGTISALSPTDPPNTIAPIGRLKLVKADQSHLLRGDDGLFRVSAAGKRALNTGDLLPADPTVRLIPGMLEGSNVNSVTAMVEMINNSRRFEMQMKVIRSVDESDKVANHLLAMN